MKSKKRASQPEAPAAERVMVARASLEALQSELARSRRAAQGFEARLADEVAVARRATEVAANARLEREEYRRVLAAAIANERKSIEAAREALAAVEAREADLRVALQARGEAEGLARELERELAALRTEHGEALRAVTDRAWADSEERQRELQNSEYERGVVVGQVRELHRRIPAVVPPSARLHRARARTQVAAAGVVGALFLVLVPETAVALLSRERGVIAGAAGLTPWALVLMELTLLAAVLLLTGAGLRQLRSAEADEEAALRDASNPRTEGLAPAGDAGAAG